MNSNEEISLSLTSKQYSAIFNIRGWPDNAHMMIMRPKTLENGSTILSGDQDAFEELVSTIVEELDYELCKKADRTHLIKVLEKFDHEYSFIYG